MTVPDIYRVLGVSFQLLSVVAAVIGERADWFMFIALGMLFLIYANTAAKTENDA